MSRVRVAVGYFCASLVAVATIGILVATDQAAAAGGYFNSSEPGCDGSNPNILLCDDFEHNANGSMPGAWYSLDCDQANAAGGINQFSKGWCGSIYANPITPPGAVDCSSGVTPFGSCAATSGFLTGAVGDRNAAMHSFPNNQEVQNIYFRYYRKNSTGFSYSGQKVLTFNRCCNTGGIFWGGLGFNIGQGSASTAAPAIGITNNLLGATQQIFGQNLGNDIAMTSGNWFYFEVHIKLNTPGNADGIFEMWINNCGSAGNACGASPVLRARYTNVNWGKTATNGGIGSIWTENWANNADGVGSNGTEWYDNVKISVVGPIGLVGGSSSTPMPPFNVGLK